MFLRKATSLLLALITVASIFSLSGCGKTTTVYRKYNTNDNGLLYDIDTTSYSYYLDSIDQIPFADNDISLSCDDISASDSFEYETSIDGEKYAFIDSNSKWVEWNVSSNIESKYFISIDYKTVSGDNTDMILSLQLDNSYPYEELKSLTLSRLFEDSCGEKFEVDTIGNDIKPSKIEVISDLSSGFFDEKGYFSDYYVLSIPAGQHKIRLSSVKGSILVKSLNFNSNKEICSYKEYISKEYISKQNDTAKNKKSIVIEAEHPKYTTDASIYAISDWQDVTTTPNDCNYVRLNAIGDSNWSKIGQEIIWELSVPETGLYKIDIRARQDYSEGMNAYRTLKIDGKVPFAEAENIAFPYDFEWKTTTLGNDKPYYLYLTKGEHTLSLAVAPGEMAESLQMLDSLVSDLNSIYRKIILVTGTTVDIYQDYDLENKIPELINSFKDIRNRITDLSIKIKKTTKSSGSRATVLDETGVLIDGFITHPYSISGGLSTYKTKIEDIASLLTNMSEQALLIDKIVLTPNGEKDYSYNASFIEKLKFSIGKFINSYSNKENNNADKKSINVWVSTGRDQAQIIKSMITNDFMVKNGIDVELNIVDTGSTLIQATLANKGPDVAINISHDTPVNLAMRDGLINLKDYVTDDVYNNFYESAWTPFLYGDGIFGVPETQIFDMLFVRNDLFDYLGIDSIPQTWDEFYKCTEKIQNNKLMVGISETNSASVAVSGGISTFQKFYFQKGYTYYNEDFTSTTFDSEEAIECMNKVCELYTQYGLDRQFDFLNRFRSGELVMGISAYSTYNLLNASAPEIAGLWSMYPIPGTKKADGTLSRAESSTGTASIILKAAEKHNLLDESWEFVKWWTSADIQSEYAERLEGVMGVAARYTPANIGAFKSIKWTKEEANALCSQWEEVYNVREIPGNYYIARSLTSAIRNTISKGTSIRFNLSKYNNDIISEITRKRKEFNIK